MPAPRSPAWRWPTSVSASPATCTTCSATRCRSSRSSPSSRAGGCPTTPRPRRPRSATTIERPEVELPSEVDAVLAWTVREAATNVIRHSGARHSAIRVLPALGQATVEVLDDGPGVDGDGGSGTGLIGLEERLRAAGGHLEAGPRADGPGFLLRATVPVASAR